MLRVQCERSGRQRHTALRVWSWRGVLLLAWFVAPLITVPAADDMVAETDISAVLLKALEARRAMRNAELLLDVDYHSNRGERLKRQYHVYFDGASCRMDTIRDNGSGTTDVEVIAVVHRNTHILYTTMKSGSGAPVASFVKDVGHTRESPGKGKIVPHPWYLGLAACEWETLGHYQPDLCITGKGNSGEVRTIEAGELEGENCLIVSKTGPAGESPYTLKGWFVSRLHNCVVKVEGVSEMDGHRQVNTSITTYDDMGGVYVPKGMHFTSVLDGKLVREESVTVAVLKLNSEIDPSTFELGGLGMKVGTPFNVYPDSHGGAYLWNGTALVPDYSDPEIPPSDRIPNRVRTVDQGKWPTIRWALIGNGVILLLVAVALWYRRSRR